MVMPDLQSLSINPQSNLGRLDTPQADSNYPPPLRLPESRYFNVTVTVVKDCSDFCLRLLGDGYSVSFIAAKSLLVLTALFASEAKVMYNLS